MQQLLECAVRKRERNNSVGRSMKKECSRHWRRDSPCSSWSTTAEQISMCSPGRSPCMRIKPEGSCTPLRTPTGAGSQADLWSMERSPQAHTGAGCLAQTAAHRGPIVEQSWGTASHGKDPLWGCSWRTVSYVRVTTLQQGKRVRRLEQQRKYSGLTTTPIAHPLHFLWVRKIQKNQEWSWTQEKRGGVQKVVVVLFSYSVILLSY